MIVSDRLDLIGSGLLDFFSIRSDPIRFLKSSIRSSSIRSGFWYFRSDQVFEIISVPPVHERRSFCSWTRILIFANYYYSSACMFYPVCFSIVQLFNCFHLNIQTQIKSQIYLFFTFSLKLRFFHFFVEIFTFYADWLIYFENAQISLNPHLHERVSEHRDQKYFGEVSFWPAEYRNRPPIVPLIFNFKNFGEF